MHDETLPAEYFKSAEFCSMCGPKFCSMQSRFRLDAVDEILSEVEKPSSRSKEPVAAGGKAGHPGAASWPSPRH